MIVWGDEIVIPLKDDGTKLKDFVVTGSYYSHLPAGFRKASGAVQKRAQPERALQIRVATMLRWMLPPDVFHSAVGHGGGGERRGQILKRMGVVAGVPDYMILWRGRVIFLEMKAGKGSLSLAQKAVHEAIVLAGGVVKTCRTEDEVVSFLETLQIPLQAKLTPAERAVLKARALAEA